MDNEIKKKSSLVQFRISGQERIMFDQLIEHFGVMRSEYLRSLIRDKHSKVFPAHTKIGREKVLEIVEDLTDEQFCEKWGGKLKRSEGGLLCTFKMGGTEARMLASDRLAVEQRGKSYFRLKKSKI